MEMETAPQMTRQLYYSSTCFYKVWYFQYYITLFVVILPEVITSESVRGCSVVACVACSGHRRDRELA